MNTLIFKQNVKHCIWNNLKVKITYGVKSNLSTLLKQKRFYTLKVSILLNTYSVETNSNMYCNGYINNTTYFIFQNEFLKMAILGDAF